LAKHQTAFGNKLQNRVCRQAELTDLQKWVRQLWTLGSKLRKERMKRLTIKD